MPDLSATTAADYLAARDILHRFDKFTPDADQIKAMDTMRSDFQDQAFFILQNTKPGREQSLALTALEEAKYWANQSIAKDGVPA